VPRLLQVVALLLLLPLLPAARPALDLEAFRGMARSHQLETPQAYLSSLQKGRIIFEKQGRWVKIPDAVPSLILPDLHAQRDYLLQALELKLDGKTVWQRLQAGQINLVLLGDAMHSEQRAQQRWLQAEAEVLGAHPEASPAMQAEMVESLGLMRMIFELKSVFPERFFFLRGNHEDMDPQRPYAKFTRVGESNLVKHWVVARFGADFLKRWSQAEKALPLVGEGGSFLASHSPPEELLLREDVLQGSAAVFHACTWSDNTRWQPGGLQEGNFLANCRRYGVTPQRPWVVGHRKVEGARYRSQCGGRLLQINPLDRDPRIYLLAPPRGKPLIPEKAVRSL
jgi:hypothetical protein